MGETPIRPIKPRMDPETQAKLLLALQLFLQATDSLDGLEADSDQAEEVMARAIDQAFDGLSAIARIACDGIERQRKIIALRARTRRTANVAGQRAHLRELESLLTDLRDAALRWVARFEALDEYDAESHDSGPDRGQR
jgi:hypothetical protein